MIISLGSKKKAFLVDAVSIVYEGGKIVCITDKNGDDWTLTISAFERAGASMTLSDVMSEIVNRARAQSLFNLEFGVSSVSQYYFKAMNFSKPKEMETFLLENIMLIKE